MNFFKYVCISFLALNLFACSKSDLTEQQAQESNAPLTQESLALEVFKSPTCGCCGVWVEHLESQGFLMSVEDTDALEAKKAELGIADELRSCHTATSENGYFFEGHIPAKYIQQFLANPPKNAKGLAVPGMPLGSPGMEMGDRFTPYNIILVKEDGSQEIYAQIDKMEDQK